jgi:ATP/maltotriose-dependent transcriptional regulator MalT
VQYKFIGRDAEIDVLSSRVATVHEGTAQLALVHGPAGIGKTRLIRELLRRQPDLTSVWVSGDESEALLPLAAVDRLRAAAGARSPARDGDMLDPLGDGVELLQVISELAAAGPTVLVIDDLQWIDGPSMTALTFVLRRLVNDRVLVVIACRDEDLDEVPENLSSLLFDGDADLRLDGFGPDELVSLSHAMGGPVLDRRAAQRLRLYSEGNPLYAATLIEELEPNALTANGDRPLPATGRFTAIVGGRLDTCSTETARFLEAAAVLGRSFGIRAAALVGGSRDELAAIDEGVRVGLVELASDPSEARFSHPLVQAAVYHRIPVRRRCQLHLAAAVTASARADELRHRAAGTIGVDQDLAEELVAFAGTECERGSWAAAADAYESAMTFQIAAADRQRCLMSAVECLLLGGSGMAAFEKLPEVEACPPSPRRDQVLGLLALVSGDRAGGRSLLEHAWAQRVDGEDDDVVLARIATQLGMVSLFDARGDDAVEWSTRALSFATASSDRADALAIGAFGYGQLGRLEDGLDSLPDLPAHAAQLDTESLGALVGRGVLRLYGDRLPESVRDLALADRAAARLGPLHLRLLSLFHLADAEYRIGRWDRALAHHELARSLGEDAGELWMLGLVHSVGAFLAAGRGQFDVAEAHIETASGVADLLADVATRVCVATAHARLAQARGDHQAMIDAVAPVLAMDDPDGRSEPGLQPWEQLLAEGLLGVGRLDEADALLVDLECRARKRGHNTCRLAVARLHGGVAAARGEHQDAAAAFDAAQQLVTEEPFLSATLEWGLLQLDHGAWLRRWGQRELALSRLDAARDVFTRLAAQPFVARVDAESAACGAPARQGADDLRSQLTPQELAVATLVASGLTNREVAAQLVLSVKTIEFHLSSVFRKAGVTNRSALAARFHD